MTEEQPTLQVSIETVEGPLRVGPNPQPPNQFILKIENLGDPVRQPSGELCRLYLKGGLGPGPEALFLNERDGKECQIKNPSTKWQVDKDFPTIDDPGQFCITIYTFDDTLFEKGEVLRFTFDGVLSKTDPSGGARLTLTTDCGAIEPELSIPKKADQPGIIYFTSTPEPGTAIFPHDPITLMWRTYNLNNRELTQVGSADPIPYDFKENWAEGKKIVQVSDSDTTFRLSGYDSGRPVSRDLRVTVVRPGWHETKNTLGAGDPGYPSQAREGAIDRMEEPGMGEVSEEPIELEPTLLFNPLHAKSGNSENATLYAIFRHEFRGGERALLFRTENPFGGWTFVESTVEDQQGRIPAGFSTSPGVYYQGRLWLIGGSQIDSDSPDMSSGVWTLDLTRENPSWRFFGNAPWSPRMGHSVVVFEDRICVLCGLGADGKALNDVWTLDEAAKQWTPLSEASEPTPSGPLVPSGRCLVNPTVFADRIWLYGGAGEPSAAKLYDDLYVFSYDEKTEKYKWDKKEITGAIKGKEARQPIASCLQVLGDKLHLFGKFRVTAEDKSRLDEPLGFYLSDPETGTWERFPSDGLATWGTHATFSYQAVNFRNRVLIARALPDRKKEPNPILKIYVP